MILFYNVQQLESPSYDDGDNEKALILLFVSAFFLGIGQLIMQYAIKQYVYTCSFKDETSKTFIRRTENLSNFIGMVAMSMSGCYFWFAEVTTNPGI
jgi:hypothetical protein